MDTALPLDTSAPIERKSLIDWRVFALLWVLNIIASLIVIPYSMHIQSASASTNPQLSMMPDDQLLIITTITQLVCGVAWNGPLLFAGMWIAPRIGLGWPLLQRLLRGQPLEPEHNRTILIGLGAGFIAGWVLLGLVTLIDPILQADLIAHNVSFPTDINPPAWQGFLASISAAITEETMLRLFLLSLLAWIGRWISRQREGKPSIIVFWIANLLATLVFGAFHIGNLAIMNAITPMMIGYAIAANGLIGLLFGWLYWKYGIESAMLAHFSTDIVLHVLAVMLAPMMS